MTTYNNIIDNLEYLKLLSIKEYIQSEYKNQKIDEIILEFVDKMLEKQVELKKQNSMLYNVKVAGFPFIKTLEDFDFDFQPSIKKEYLETLLIDDFHLKAENIIFMGSPGVGKTHLSISIAKEVACKRNTVYFIKFSKLIMNLKDAYNEGNLERKIKVYNKYKLLIIDELGFNEISELESKLFFQLIDNRYETRSVIITTNIGFEKWDKIFGNDDMITRAILDRLLHHSHLLNITGPSYRIKDKMIDTTDEGLSSFYSSFTQVFCVNSNF